ncbi:MAG: hypothetical protein LUQ12_00320 [Methanoregulaceae archaeon]|nr:hypothetical protein [Methanoregulaceae archaeon]
MKTNTSTEITDAKSRELTEPGEKHQPYGFIIPAGILIGLGVGMLVDYVVSGFLVGLGIGFLGSGLLPLVRKPLESEYTQPGSTDVTMLFIGAFLLFLGISIVYAPAVLWPYAIAGFLVLLGIWFLIRGFFQIK